MKSFEGAKAAIATGPRSEESNSGAGLSKFISVICRWLPERERTSEPTVIVLRIVKSFVVSSVRVKNSGNSMVTITHSSRTTTGGTISLPISVRLPATCNLLGSYTLPPGKMGTGKSNSALLRGLGSNAWRVLLGLVSSTLAANSGPGGQIILGHVEQQAVTAERSQILPLAIVSARLRTSKLECGGCLYHGPLLVNEESHPRALSS
jgi:hypothetical protein